MHRLSLLLALAVAACAEDTLPNRGYQVSTFGSVTAAAGIVGPAYSSSLFSTPVPYGTGWQTGTAWWSGTGNGNGVLVDYGDYTCSITSITLQSDHNDNSYVDYYANGVWTALQFGTCSGSVSDGPAACQATGGGVVGRTRSGLTLTGVSKLRTYCGAGDYLCSVARLYAVGSCTPGGILPASTEAISTTGGLTAATGYLVTPSSSKLHQAMLPEGTQWQTDTIYWTGTGSANSVVVDLIGTCAINKVIVQTDNNDQVNVEYYANGQWNAVAFGYCDGSQGSRPGVCTTIGGGMRTITKTVSMTGATRLRVICTAGDTNCAVSRLFAFGSCVLPTLDPAVNAFCVNLGAQCAALASDCNTLHTLNHSPAAANDCDSAVAACNDVHQDCVNKVGTCHLG